MKLFEYEAKAILRKYGINVPNGRIARTAEEAASIARELGRPVFLKSQTTVSGRGKAGGIVPASTADEAREVASGLIGSVIKNVRIGTLLVEEKLDLREELYASVTIDRQARRLVVLASTGGGVDIEEIAKHNRENIASHLVDPLSGFSQTDAERLVAGFQLSEEDEDKFASILTVLYKLAMEYDAELVELNPLAITTSRDFVAADAKITMDDSAIYRHPEFAERSLRREEDTPREAKARRQKYTYVDLDGDIGIVGNGAGLTMATVDMVNLAGGRPANFLDIGGGARTDVIKNGFKMVLEKPEVRAVLVNILGGITRCDAVAGGVVEALKESDVKKPVVVRMVGTGEEEGIQLLQRAGIQVFANMEEAVRQVLQHPV